MQPPGPEAGPPRDALPAAGAFESTVISLARAATEFDAAAITATVEASIPANGVAQTWDRLIRPAWTSLVHGDGRVPVVAERLFCRAVTQALITTRRPGDRGRARVLLACADEEHESLPMEAVAAALAESGTGSCVLGARVPPQALTAAVSRLRPAVVIVWSQTCETADPEQISTSVKACPSPAVIVAGPGWDMTKLPATAAPSFDVAAVLDLTRRLLEERSSRAKNPGQDL